MSVFDNMLTMPEIINNVPENSSFKAALFDFDGTLSLIRQGWQDIMIPYFCEEIYSSGCTISETDEEIKAIVTDFVDELTGKQTIFQCIRLKDEIENRGGNVKNEMD